MKAKGVYQASAQKRATVPLLSGFIPRIGVLSWSFVGIVVASSLVVVGLAAVSEIMLPILLAAVLAVVLKPLSGFLVGRGFKPGLAAGTVVVCFLALMIGVAILAVRGVIDQGAQINTNSDVAITSLSDLTDVLSIEEASLQAVKKAVQEAVPMITTGILAGIVSVFGTLIALVSGSILGALVMYYLLKDGTGMRKTLVSQVRPVSRRGFDDFIGAACRIFRDYYRGRTIMSAIVAAVLGVAALLLGLPLILTIVIVNFIGGYIPYIGAFLGGGLAVIVALSEGGITAAILMLVVVLASNLILENFIGPGVMGSTLNVHPLTVLVVTALGGVLGGIVGLMLAVPIYVVAANAVQRLRSGSLAE